MAWNTSRGRRGSDQLSGAGFTAHQGAITVPNHFITGLIFNPTDDTWRDLAVSDLDELGQRKAAATALYAALNGQEDEIGQRMGIPAKVQGRVQDILAYARWALYAVFTGSTYTAAQQIAWAGAMLTGPSDATDLDTLIQKSSAMTDAEVPTTTSAWVSPVDGSRSATAGSKVASDRWNSGIGDLTNFNPGNGAWITDLT